MPSGWMTGSQDTVDSYVARAVAAARDLAALARLRAELRPRFAASPLRDAAVWCAVWKPSTRTAAGMARGRRTRLHRLNQAGGQFRRQSAGRHMLERDPGHAGAASRARPARPRREPAVHSERSLARSDRPHTGPSGDACKSCSDTTRNGSAHRRRNSSGTALRHQPENVAAHNNLGNILRDAGRYDESVSCYRTAVRLRRNLSTPGSTWRGYWRWPDRQNNRKTPRARLSPAIRAVPTDTTIWGWP